MENTLYNGYSNNYTMLLSNVFPHGFKDDYHYDKTHGASTNSMQIIYKFSIFNNRQFAITINGDIFISMKINTGYYNTCASRKMILNDKHKNSKWNICFKEIMNYCNSNKAKNFY